MKLVKAFWRYWKADPFLGVVMIGLVAAVVGLALIGGL